MADGAADRSALAGKTAIVSGASSGVGKAVALALGEAGCNVVALGRRAEAPPEFSAYAALRYLPIDLAAADPAGELRSMVPNEIRKVDVLVNCAAHDYGGGVAFGDHAREHWQNAIDVNLQGAMCLTGACLPAMIARDRGDIVFIGSITSRRTARNLAAYTATKHALHGFAEAVRVDYSDAGLRVVEIIPSAIRTGFASHRWGGDEARAAAFYDQLPACLAADDIARAVLYALQQPAHVSVAEIVLLPTREQR